MEVTAWDAKARDENHLSSHTVQHSAIVAGGKLHLAECGIWTLAGQNVVLNLISSDVKSNKLHLLGLVLSG